MFFCNYPNTLFAELKKLIAKINLYLKKNNILKKNKKDLIQVEFYSFLYFFGLASVIKVT